MDLSNYVRVGRYDLPEPTRTTAPAGNLLGQEASGVTYNWDTDTLFIIGDGGRSITEVSKTGTLVSTMTLGAGDSPQGTAFYDPEGITYIGGGQFVFTEERDRNAVLISYEAGATKGRADAQVANIGTFVNNIGLEGLTFDPLTGGFIFVKESGPIGVFQTTIDFGAHIVSNGSATTANSANLFDPALLGLSDVADVFALSNLPSFAGTPEEDNLLIISQEEGKILKVDRDGNILGELLIQTDAGNPLGVADQQHEGITVDRNGLIYIVNENGGGDADHPQMWVYAPADYPNAAPTGITLGNALTAIEENTGTSSRVKVADIVIADDGIGVNTLSLSGADAGSFEVDSTGLYLKAGTVLDYETKTGYAVTVSVDDANVGDTPDASVDYVLDVTDIANETTAPTLFISEVAPWSSGNSAVAADWFEVTNNGRTAIDVTGWRMDDSSAQFGNSRALTGITSIGAGESVIFFETADLEATKAAFIANWFGGTAPDGVQFGAYTGSGVGLGTGGDQVNLYNSTGELQASVSFGASPADNPYATFNNAGAVNNAEITTLSEAGTNGAAAVTNGAVTEIGSPGTVGRLFVSEVAPWASGDSPVGFDWFEITNFTDAAVDVAGWRVDDGSNSFASSVTLNGVGSVAAGQSVIFLNTDDLAQGSAAFIDTWFGGQAPQGIVFGSYDGSGIGLSTGGDAINLFNAVGDVMANVAFGAATGAPALATFDNADGLNNVLLTNLAVAGQDGAFRIDNGEGNTETGSPGYIARSLITGDDGNNTLTGTVLDDTLLGGAGNDMLSGLGGNDWIVGGAGSDTLRGGEGSDAFFFTQADNGASTARAIKKTVDRIVDFSSEDVLVTDVALFDSNSNDVITFGSNRVLDLTGGGQVNITDAAGKRVTAVEFDGIWRDEATGIDHYVYSLVGSAAGVSTLDMFG